MGLSVAEQLPLLNMLKKETNPLNLTASEYALCTYRQAVKIGLWGKGREEERQARGLPLFFGIISGGMEL